MKQKKVAKKYAVALFEVLNPNEFENSLEILKSYNQAVSPYQDFFANPSISLANKHSVLDSSTESLPQTLKNFLKVLLENSRFSSLTEIVQTFQALVVEFQKSLELEVISASELSQDQKDQIKNEILSNVNSKAIVKFSSDSNLIAGYQIRCVDRVLDYSANRILDEAKRFLIK